MTPFIVERNGMTTLSRGALWETRAPLLAPSQDTVEALAS